MQMFCKEMKRSEISNSSVSTPLSRKHCLGIKGRRVFEMELGGVSLVRRSLIHSSMAILFRISLGRLKFI